MSLNSKFLVSLLVVTLGSGCSLAPDYLRPEISLPEKFQANPAHGESIADLPWWNVFSDPKLKELITAALENNRNLAESAARIRESRALLGFVRADQYPFVGVSAGAQRADGGGGLGSVGTVNDYRMGGDLSFELDVWGKLSSATDAQIEELLATEYGHRSVTLTLVAQVASTYFRLLDVDERLEITNRTVKNRHETTELIRVRLNSGIVPELDVNQAEIEEFEANITRSQLERERAQLVNALNVLLGRSHGTITRSTSSKSDTLPLVVPTGLPAALLERRPDILSSEATVRSIYERVGVAQAQRLPSFTLTGFLGLRSQESSDVFSSDSRSWSVGGGLLSPLIDWGQNEARVEVEKARAEQALKNYEQVVFVAVQEVEDALTGVTTFQTELEARLAQVRSASNAARLSRARYEDGVAPYLEVLDTDRSLFSAELGASSARQGYRVSLVQLYKALGGGWQQKLDAKP